MVNYISIYQYIFHEFEYSDNSEGKKNLLNTFL